MQITRRIQITTETKRIVVVHNTRCNAPLWCAECGAFTPRLNPEQAAGLRGIAIATVYRWLAEGRLHDGGTPTSAALLCLNALLQVPISNANDPIQQSTEVTTKSNV